MNCVLDALTVKSLRKIAKDSNLSGYSRKRKKELVVFLIQNIDEDILEKQLTKYPKSRRGGKKEAKKVFPLERLTAELFAKVVFFVEDKDIARLKTISKKIKALCEHDGLWQQKVRHILQLEVEEKVPRTPALTWEQEYRKQKEEAKYKDKATIHLISGRKIFGEEYDENEDLHYKPIPIDLIEKTYPGITKTMKRGDIIENIDESGYRSNGVFFFDGKKVIGQYYELDDYGSPPQTFYLITEFPPSYWDQDYGERVLKVNDAFQEGKSVFAWHSPEGTFSPLDLEKLPEILEKIKHDMKQVTITYDGEYDWSRTSNYIILEYQNKKYMILLDVYQSDRDPLIELFVLNRDDGCLKDYSEAIGDPTIDYLLDSQY